jgi:hypothetical protein
MAAGPSTRTLTTAEFQHLLQRAAERDVYREPRLFTLPELVAAGQELGIDPRSVQEVYGEYQQQAARPLRPVRQRPMGSHIQLHKRGDVLQLIIPPLRNRNGVEGAASLGAAAVLGVMAYGYDEMSFVALPFMFAFIALGIYLLIRPRQTSGGELRLFRDGSGVLMEFRRGTTKSYPLIAGQVHARLTSVTENTQSGPETFHYLALDHATTTHALMADFSHPERAWVVDEIESWLGR